MAAAYKLKQVEPTEVKESTPPTSFGPQPGRTFMFSFRFFLFNESATMSFVACSGPPHFIPFGFGFFGFLIFRSNTNFQSE